MASFLRPLLAIAFCVIPVCLIPTFAHAQPDPFDSGSQSVLFDPSIEAAGMGGVGVAVFWRDEPNSWANPALLGAQQGFRYSYGRTQILEELAADVYLKSHRFLLGGWGVGLLFAGKPIDGLGSDIRLEYGPTELTDIDGNVTATVEPYDQVLSFGVGVSVLEVVSNLMEAAGADPIGFRRYLSVLVGHTWKDFEIDLSPGVQGAFPRGEGEQKDRGAAIRIAPVDQIGPDLLEPSDRSRLRLELAAGYAQLNYDDAVVTFEGQPSDPIFELRRVGGSGRITLALPSARTGRIHDFISPSVSLGVAYESNDYYDGDTDLGFDIKRFGAEMSVADVLFLRYGHVEDEVFGIDDGTWGAGLALQYRKAAGVRLDYAHYPYSPFLDEEYVDRYGITAFIDPFRLARL